jgi:RNA polymerase sigma factor FliA
MGPCILAHPLHGLVASQHPSEDIMVVTALSTQNSEQDTRQQLILDHYPLVRTIACRMVRRFPSCVDVDELINVGALGLMDAVDRFDSSREVPFKAYAEIRIRGAIVDALREADWVPRSVRRKYNKIENARATLHRQLGRDPSRAELAHALELTMDQFDALAGDAQVRKLVSLDNPVDDDNMTPLSERLSDDSEELTELWAKAELKDAVVQAVQNLPKKERTAVALYYLNQLTLKEIGRVLGVTESRACQLRAQGVKRLKFRLRAESD